MLLRCKTIPLVEKKATIYPSVLYISKLVEVFTSRAQTHLKAMVGAIAVP